MRSPQLGLSLAIVAACAGGGGHPEVPTPATPDAAAPARDAATVPHAMTLAESGIVPEWLDRGADPCEDFFQYACGGFVATAKIPPDRDAWSAIEVVVESGELFLKQVLDSAAADPAGNPGLGKLGDYYAACLDETAVDAAGATPLAPLFAQIDKVKDATTLGAAVAQLHALGIWPLFDILPTQDYADATQVIAGLDQNGLGLPDRDYYVEDSGNMKEVRTAYRAHVGRMLALLGWAPDRVATAVDDVIRIETALATAQQKNVTRRDPTKIYHRVDRAGLAKAAKGFPWKAYFAALGLGGNDAITVNDPAYFAAIVKLARRERPRALRNYLTWIVTASMAPHLARAFVDEALAMDKVLTGVEAVPPRWRTCVHRVDEDLGELLAQPYVAARFSADAKRAARTMTDAVVAAMADELATLAWMDDATRQAARGKLDQMAYLIGFPERWRSYDFAVSRTDFAANVLAASRFEMTRQLGKIGKPVDRFDWQMTPPTVNAYYDSSLNEIALPAGQLQPPFFGVAFHPAVNFGSTGGGTIGHEMTHGFDDEGSQFDADGNLRDWWSAATKQQFAAATACVVDQYAAYEAVPGVHLDGKLTAGENIADIGGVKIGYQAYQRYRAAQSPPPPAVVDGFTDDQLYFLAYGQSWCTVRTPQSEEMRAHTNPHSPARWRVNGVVVDQPGFGPAFHCAAGRKMNPGNACAVW